MFSGVRLSRTHVMPVPSAMPPKRAVSGTSALKNSSGLMGWPVCPGGALSGVVGASGWSAGSSAAVSTPPLVRLISLGSSALEALGVVTPSLSPVVGNMTSLSAAPVSVPVAVSVAGAVEDSVDSTASEGSWVRVCCASGVLVDVALVPLSVVEVAAVSVADGLDTSGKASRAVVRARSASTEVSGSA